MKSYAKAEPVIVPGNLGDLDKDSDKKEGSRQNSVVSTEKNVLVESGIDLKKELDPEKNDVNDEFVLTGTSPTYIRHKFARKVFLIVFLQLVFSFSFILTMYLIEASREFFKRVPYLGVGGAVVFIILIIALACKPAIGRNRVSGIIITVLVTVSFTLIATTAACYYKFAELIGAMGTTLFVTLCLTLFAIQTKYDFTSWIGYLFMISCFFLCFSIFASLFKSTVVRLIVTGFGTLLVCFYILLDVQLIMGGKRKHQFSIDDYYFASIVLYSDIMSLFIRLLSLIGGK